MKKVLVSALAATMVLTGAMSAEAGQYRKKYRGVDPGAAIAAGIIGLAAGAIIAGAANSNRGYYDNGDVYLVGYDAYGNPIYRKRPRQRVVREYYQPNYQPNYQYYGNGYQRRYAPGAGVLSEDAGRAAGYPVYNDYYRGQPYGGQAYRAPRPRDVSPEDRLRVIGAPQGYNRAYCKTYGCARPGY